MDCEVTIKGILFDKDGTLIEVNGTWIPLYKSMLAKEFGHEPHEVEDLLTRVGYNRETETVRAGSAMAGGTTREIASLWWPEISAEQRKERVYHIDNVIGPQAKSFVKPLMD